MWQQTLADDDLDAVRQSGSKAKKVSEKCYVTFKSFLAG